MEIYTTIGIIGWLGNLMSDALRFIYSFTQNWGLAIIVFTLLIRLVLHPLNKKQMDSVKAMQEIQPEVEKLRKKYKNDQQQLQTKLMELYKERGINPAAGCLPLLIQMPILIALFQSIRNLEELENASFLWLDSLTKTGDLLLIILTGAVTFAQSYLQQKMTANINPGNQNNIMMYMMPILIILIGKGLPAGVLLYWFTSTLVMTIQQFINYKEPVSKGETK
ncbi:YidC/Oxa1 family membrane protein insertase [Anoxybacter fermentans]|nr:YidC/Oxa1 family membrane protein insertase [Anoxybacter fermentans]